MKFNLKTPTALMITCFVFTIIHVTGQTVPIGKYKTTNYPKDRAIINSIKNSFGKSLSLDDDYVGIGADGKMSFGIPSNFKLL